jgi:hypothetical protein
MAAEVQYLENDILKLRGIGKTVVPILKVELKKAGLTFSEKSTNQKNNR